MADDTEYAETLMDAVCYTVLYMHVHECAGITLADTVAVWPIRPDGNLYTHKRGLIIANRHPLDDCGARGGCVYTVGQIVLIT